MLTFEPEPVPIEMDDTGTARVAGTRLTLDTVVACYDRGESPQDIVNGFPPLGLGDLYAVLTYVERHRPAVDAYLKAGEEQAQRVRAMIEADQGTHEELRRRLKERWAQRQQAGETAASPGG